jgi:hypothetical protein
MSEPKDYAPHPDESHQLDVHCVKCGEPMMLHVSFITYDEVVRVERMKPVYDSDNPAPGTAMWRFRNYPETMKPKDWELLARAALEKR